MNNAKSTEPEAVRKAILAIKGYKGLEGTYEFDARGDGVHGYNVVKNEGGKDRVHQASRFPDRVIATCSKLRMIFQK